MWIDYSSNEIDAPLASWIYPLWGLWPYDKKARAAAAADVRSIVWRAAPLRPPGARARARVLLTSRRC